MRTKAEIRAIGGKDELLAELCRINPSWNTRKSVKNMNMDDLVDLIREEESTDSPLPPRNRVEPVEVIEAEIIEVHLEPRQEHTERRTLGQILRKKKGH